MSSSLQKRLRFDHAVVEQDPSGEVRVTVSLSFGQRVVEATVGDAGRGEGELKTAATAALKAVEQSVAGRFTCVLADVDRVTALGQVFGSCQIAGNEVDAAVKATLNATNRFFELSMRD
jgi:ABC-type phosphonate transport system ATPase subunit